MCSGQENNTTKQCIIINMAALDFPASPSDGDIYGSYIYDASRGVWNVNAQGVASRFIVSDTKPSVATSGDAWFDTTEGVTYVYYDDGSSAQWVESGNQVLSYNTVANLTDTTITSATDGQALVFDSATGNWINETPASTVDSLTDTTISSPATGESLVYNGSAWVNEPTIINTDGDPGTKIYVGSVDPSASYVLEAGDIWIEI